MIVDAAKFPYMAWMCDVCGKRRLWKTAWGTCPHLKCTCANPDDMQLLCKVPAGAAWVYDLRREAMVALMKKEIKADERH